MQCPAFPLIEQQVRLQYRLLNHEGFYTRVRASHEPKEKAEKYLRGIEEILNWARPRHTFGNLYISRNPFKEDRTVASITGFSVDVDQIREPKDRATTEAELRRTLNVAAAINSKFGNTGTLATSGNGALLLFPFEAPVTDDIEGFVAKAQRFEKQLQDEFQTDEVRIDATNYAKAILRLLGSRNVKDGDSTKHRYARFIRRPVFFPKRSPIRSRIEGVSLPQSVVVPELCGTADSVSNKGICDAELAFHNEGKRLGPAARLDLAEKSLRRLNRIRCDNYDDWLKCGIALKEFGPAGLSLWKLWSRQSPKYREGDCESKWNTFRGEQRITIGTLKYWADNDDPRGSLALSSTGLLPGVRVLSNGIQSGHEPPTLWTPGQPFRSGEGKDSGNVAISTGFKWLDSKLNGGYRPGVLYGVFACTNVGKSAWLVQIAQQCCETGRKVLFVATEASIEEVCQRYWACGTGIPCSQISSGSLSTDRRQELERYQVQFRENHRLGVWYTVSPKTDEIERQIEEFKPDIVVWDYFQHFETGTEGRQIQLGALARWFESATLRFQIPFVVAAQLHERYDFKTGKRQPANKGDVKDCKVICDTAKTIIVLDWDQKTQTSEDAPVLVRVSLDKNKGPQGETRLLLRREIPRFEEI